MQVCICSCMHKKSTSCRISTRSAARLRCQVCLSHLEHRDFGACPLLVMLDGRRDTDQTLLVCLQQPGVCIYADDTCEVAPEGHALQCLQEHMLVMLAGRDLKAQWGHAAPSCTCVQNAGCRDYCTQQVAMLAAVCQLCSITGDGERPVFPGKLGLLTIASLKTLQAAQGSSCHLT